MYFDIAEKMFVLYYILHIKSCSIMYILSSIQFYIDCPSHFIIVLLFFYVQLILISFSFHANSFSNYFQKYLKLNLLLKLDDGAFSSIIALSTKI